MQHLKVIITVVFCCFFQLNWAQQDVQSFMFGHSLMDHAYGNGQGNIQTKIAYWIYELATEAGHTYEATGQFGHLPHHDNLTPDSQWNYGTTPSSPWDASTNPAFGSADFDNVLLTPLNYIQWKPANDPYDPPSEPLSPVQMTANIFDWVAQQEPGIRVYIYESWADMDSYLAGIGASFPPNSADLMSYNNFLNGNYRDWWIDYHDSVNAALPNADVKMIPVGPVIANLLNGVLSQIPAVDLYEDGAPHGYESIYFLAGLVTYMAMFEEQAPTTLTLPATIHADIQNNYITIVNNVWADLQAFNYPNGDSRVFFPGALAAEMTDFFGHADGVQNLIKWKTATEINHDYFEIERANGRDYEFSSIGGVQAVGNSETETIYRFTDTKPAENLHYYRLKSVNSDGSFSYSGTIAIENRIGKEIKLYPNLVEEVVLLEVEKRRAALVNISIVSIDGRGLQEFEFQAGKGENRFELDLKDLEKGIYFLKTEGKVIRFVKK